MPNTYTQLYIHIVFTVKKSDCFLPQQHRDEIQKYIAGIIRNKKCKPLAANSVRDHIHILIGLDPAVAISELVHDIKINSTNFINERKFIRGKFSWQTGFGAFSCSRSHMSNTITYIANQESHHARTTFREEYLNMLKVYDVEYDEKYLFEFFDRKN